MKLVKVNVLWIVVAGMMVLSGCSGSSRIQLFDNASKGGTQMASTGESSVAAKKAVPDSPATDKDGRPEMLGAGPSRDQISMAGANLSDSQLHERAAGVEPDKGKDEPEPPTEPLRKPYQFKAPVERYQSSTPGGDETLTFNFDDADLYEVVRIIGEVLGLNYIVDQAVTGKVTIHTSGNLTKKELIPIFHQILEINGLAAVQEGNLVKIVNAKDVPRMPATPLEGGGRVIQIVPLNYVDGAEVTKLLTPFMSTAGVVVSDKASNTLIIVEREANISKLLKLIDLFDVDIFENVKHRFYRLENVEAAEASKLLTEILTAQGDKDAYTMVPITRLNTLMVVCKKNRDFNRIDALMTRIDEFSTQADPQLYVYSVRNGQAEELSSLLNSVFQTGSTKKDSKIESMPTASKDAKDNKTESSTKKDLFPVAAELKKPVQTKSSGSASEGTGTLKGEVRITPDTIRNALIIQALPSDYRLVSQILERVDILPRQVLIEVIIAEITLSDTNKLGVEWSFNNYDSASTSGKGNLSGTLGSAGLLFKYGVGNKLDADITALAENSNVNIISSPRVMASDNTAARINISSKIPVASTSYDYNSTSTTNGVFQTDIQYKDTGIILSVTPHINDRGLVSMEISQEVSDTGATYEVDNKQYLSFSERKVETSLTVKDNQTIVIGGLMREKEDASKNGLPFLSRIPGIGFLFGKQNNTKEKTELILLITPRVVKDLDDIDYVSQEFKEKVGTTMSSFKTRISPLR
ncbi:MAG: type II secretion system secretin GspD [Pseudomonadota bacterium]